MTAEITDPSLELAECRDVLRAMALELSRAQDEERIRIAHGLHDDLGQALAAVQIRLAEIEASTSEKARSALVQATSQLVNDAVDSVRTLTFELMAPVMPEIGVDGELERLATRLTERYDIPCRFDSDSEPTPLSPEVAITVLRVGRELMHNIAKHSQAEKATVVVARAGDQLRLTVSDDGIGFQAKEPVAPERVGFGLLIVQERLAEIGGDFEVGPGPDGGTRIVVTAPLLKEAE